MCIRDSCCSVSPTKHHQAPASSTAAERCWRQASLLRASVASEMMARRTSAWVQLTFLTSVNRLSAADIYDPQSLNYKPGNSDIWTCVVVNRSRMTVINTGDQGDFYQNLSDSLCRVNCWRNVKQSFMQITHNWSVVFMYCSNTLCTTVAYV